jgi:acyl-CoA synthetase (NDP forming)
MPLSEKMKAKLRRALEARRIALVGASPEQLSVGMGPLFNLASSSFQGEILPVNPKYREILGFRCYRELEEISPPPELAIILLNQHLAVDTAERAARLGVQAVTIVAGGFKEFRSGGAELDRKLRSIASAHEMPVIGPNTLGFSAFHRGIHGIFWHLEATPGPVCILSQSGGVGLTIAHNLRQLRCGLSHFIGVGNGTVVGFADYLALLQADAEIGAFCLFIEGLKHPRDLLEVARSVTLTKPVVVYKGGRHHEVSRATVTHTGAMAGEYRIYQALFQQAGMLEARTTWEAAVLSKALSMVHPPAGNRICALTFTAGPSIVAMDNMVAHGWQFPDLSENARNKIRSIIGANTPVEIQNPVDLTGPGFLPHPFGMALRVLAQEHFDAYFLVWSYNPLIRVPVSELENFQKAVAKPTVVVLLAEAGAVAGYLEDLTKRGICAFLTPEDGATALNALLSRSRILGRQALAHESDPPPG